MKQTLELQKLIQEILKAQREYEYLSFDEEFKHELGPPASTDQIKKLERILGYALPSSYRAFMELHNGWNNFHGDGKLLAIEDHGSDWVKEKIKYWTDLWDVETENPFKHGAIPILLGNSLHHFLVLDPTRPRGNGNMDFVLYDYMHEDSSYEDFMSYLQHELEILRRLIDRETKGMIDVEEDQAGGV